MANPNVEFTNLSSIRPEALGEPGQRTFRILVDGEIDSATIWLEKEQLFQLAIAITRLQATLPEKEGPPGQRSAGDTEQPPARLEFKVGKLVLGHEGHSDRFIIDAHDVELGEDEPPTVRLWGHRSMLASFAEQSLHI